jgi:hypothetical protein
MATQTSLPNEKLSPWYFATRYAAMVLEQRITVAQEQDLPCEYDECQLERLKELEEFLDYSWKVWIGCQEEMFEQQSPVFSGAQQ